MAAPPTRSSQAFRATQRFADEARSLGAQIRSLRTARGWSLYTAAEKMSIDLKHLQKAEAGTLNLTLVTLLRIADGFDVTLGELFAASVKGSVHARRLRAKPAFGTTPKFKKVKKRST